MTPTVDRLYKLFFWKRTCNHGFRSTLECILMFFCCFARWWVLWCIGLVFAVRQLVGFSWILDWDFVNPLLNTWNVKYLQKCHQANFRRPLKGQFVFSPNSIRLVVCQMRWNCAAGNHGVKTHNYQKLPFTQFHFANKL